jgi:23S rRNA pseudouridine1911/1915/1917 synthase
LQIRLETGRMHQIRLQCSSRGYPILGDALYGSTVSFGLQHGDQRLKAIALHARSLRFLHPRKREMIYCEARIPQCWDAFQHMLGSPS